jgi:phospholipid/cholesterol/gamma-HCH transport system permease protein
MPDSPAPEKTTSKLKLPIEQLGSSTISAIEELGQMIMLLVETFVWAVRPPYRVKVFFQALESVGVGSLFIVLFTGTFTGLVMAYQSIYAFSLFNAQTLVGGTVAASVVRELGPVLTGLMVAGRTGSSMTTELGTMRVTEQIDALECMGANPIYYLVVPRFLGCLVLIPTLTVMADFMGVLGGYLYSHLLLGIDYHHYWTNSREYVDAFDFLLGIFKSFFFGAAIALVSCHRGFTCEPGAEGVGRAATNAFVHSFILILVLDLFLGIGLDNLHDLIRPEGPRKLL